MYNVYSCNRDGFFLGVVRDPTAIVADFGRPMSLADSLTRAGISSSLCPPSSPSSNFPCSHERGAH